MTLSSRAARAGRESGARDPIQVSTNAPDRRLGLDLPLTPGLDAARVFVHYK